VAVFWQRLQADLSCWLNIGENFSILLLLPIVGFALVGIIANEATSIALMQGVEMNFIHRDLIKDAR